MNNALPSTPATPDLEAALAAARAGFAETPCPAAPERIDRLERLRDALLVWKDCLIAAVDKDFGGRAGAETLITEILPVLEGIHYNKKRVKKWMKPSRRRTPLALFGSRARVHYQPLGVVGIVVPWNFPVFLALSPLAGVLAAGNRAMIKTSEFAPATGEALRQMIEGAFAPEEVAVFGGDVEVATAFTKLPFDHLVFTGSTGVGRIVMRAAAENLTPVTLELGGKSPAIIHESFPLEEAARRIAFAKGLNAGQVCIAPDYVLLPRASVSGFVEAFSTAFTALYPSLEQNADYSSIITDHQRQRLLDTVADAEEKGARVIRINPAGEEFATGRKLPMHILTEVSDGMRVMQEEIFGPILPVIPYDTPEAALAFVNARPRPLALYYFDWDASRAAQVLRDTHSGGVCINDAVTHAAVDDMPFGGIGPSGMGQYHGREGFLTFSNAKGVVHKGRFNANAFVEPPWGKPLYRAYTALQLWRFGGGGR